MTVLNILCFPDERLRTTAKTVTEVTADTRQLVTDLFETMYQAPGIGLAATQVDVHLRVIVIDISENKDDGLVLINPKILAADGHEKMEEGCLSVPGVYEQVERADHIKVSTLDLDGETQEFEAQGLLAVCIQHEIDHLEGKLFVDYLSEMKRQRIKKKIQKQTKQDHIVM